MTDFFSSVSLPIKSSGLSFDAIKNKLLWKKRSLNLTDYDPVYKVIYLGNVLTPWAKGEGCCEKPLATLWKNYCSNVKHEIYMKLTVCNAGLKAITREHGLTEYWSNRITYCCSHPKYPRVFCWVYRHEGRKLKQELRCHAVLCGKESKAQEAASQLSLRLVNALSEFRREKRMRQNTRLLQSKSIQCHPSLPQLQTENLITNCPSSSSSTTSSISSSISSSSSTTSSTSSKSSSDHSSTGSSNGSCCTNNNNNYRKRMSCNNQIPAKKKYLVKGQANFRPPLERSKSAPRLTSIDELQEDDLQDGDDDNDDVDDDPEGEDVVGEDSDSLKILLLNRILLLRLDDEHQEQQHGLNSSKAGYINT